MKKCFKCGEDKELSDFYKHSQMKGGYLNKCKECTKKDIKKNYSENIDKYRSYENKRNTLPHRVAARKAYAKSAAGKEAAKRGRDAWRKRNPLKVKAHRKIQYELSKGTLTKPKHCSICGAKDVNIHGHHEDYTKPLDVIWCCEICHTKIHKEKQNET